MRVVAQSDAPFTDATANTPDSSRCASATIRAGGLSMSSRRGSAPVKEVMTCSSIGKKRIWSAASSPSGGDAVVASEWSGVMNRMVFR